MKKHCVLSFFLSVILSLYHATLTHLSLALENTGHLRLKISIYERKILRIDLIYCITNIEKTVIWDCRVLLLPITNAVTIPLKTQT